MFGVYEIDAIRAESRRKSIRYIVSERSRSFNLALFRIKYHFESGLFFDGICRGFWPDLSEPARPTRNDTGEISIRRGNINSQSHRARGTRTNPAGDRRVSKNYGDRTDRAAGANRGNEGWLAGGEGCYRENRTRPSPPEPARIIFWKDSTLWCLERGRMGCSRLSGTMGQPDAQPRCLASGEAR